MNTRTRAVAILAPVLLALTACTVNVGGSDETPSVPPLPAVPTDEVRDHTDTTDHDRDVTLLTAALVMMTPYEQDTLCDLWDANGSAAIAVSLNAEMVDASNHVTAAVVDDVFSEVC